MAEMRMRFLLLFYLGLGVASGLIIGKGGSAKLLSLSKETLELKGVMELIASSEFGVGEYEVDDAKYADAVSKWTPSPKIISERQGVEEGLKQIQRLQLQLDRSDGRPDFTADKLADRYYNELIAVCLRAKGPAWTATLSPCEYVGLNLRSFVSIQQGANQRQVDVPSLCSRIGKCLIDMPTEKAAIDQLQQKAPAVTSIRDLFLALTRVAIRCAILGDQLDGNALPSTPFALSIKHTATSSEVAPLAASLSLSEEMVLVMLLLDFGFTPASVSSQGGQGTLLVNAEAVSEWMKKKALQ